jgi:hypothetical protein
MIPVADATTTTQECFMFSRKLVALAVLFVATLALCADDKTEKKTDQKPEENPYKKAEKGQWATYKLAMKFAGQNIDGSLKQTVTAKDDKSVTLESVANVLGQEKKETHKIDLTKPFNPLDTQQLPPGAEVKLEKKESGKESIEVAGRKQETEWTSYKVAVSANGMNFDGDVKVWVAKDVPMGGVVKTEMKMKFGGMDMEMAMNMDKFGKD